MNRRTLLRSAGTLGIVAVAGCLDDDRDGIFQNPFDGVGLQRPVPVELVSEAENAYNVQLDAFERGTTRGTYEEAYTVTPGQRVSAPHLDTTEQRFRVTRLGGDDGDDLVEESAIGEHSRLVLIRIDDADLEVEVIEDEEEAEEEQEELEDDDFDERDEDDGDPN